MKKAILLSFVFFCFQTTFLCSQNIMTYAGNGVFAYTGDGVQATTTSLANPNGLAVDALGNLYIADFDNSRIRKVTPSGIITTVAGNGTPGFSGDGGLATSAQINEPMGVAVDNLGNIYISDSFNYRIRKVSASGIITTIAGCGVTGFSGDGGPATLAKFDYPTGIAVDPSGNVYVADWANNRIRVINPSGTISTFAGNGTNIYFGEGVPATNTGLYYPQAVCADLLGNVYITDCYNGRVRKVNTSGNITTIAGGGTVYTSGVAATSVGIDDPIAITVDMVGNVYIIVENFNLIFKINTSGITSTICKWFPNGYAGDGGPAINAVFFYPIGIAIDASGNLFISDSDNNRVRVICALPSIPGTIIGNTTICPVISTNNYSVAPVTGAATYSWSLPGSWIGTSNTNSISITTNGNGGIISVSAINSCGSSSGQTTLAVNVSALPNVSISPSNTISCSGNSLTLSASGANTYSWSTGVIANSISVSPTTNVIYTVTGTDILGCTNTATQNIVVNSLPVLNISVSSSSLCSGQTDTLNVVGANTYTWLPGNTNTSSLVVSPNSNQTYTAFGTDALGCSNSSQTTISVTPTPTLAITPFFYLCSGSATLIANGATTYSWMPGNINSNSITPSPTVTTNYTVVGANGTCTNSSISTVSVGFAPPLVLSANIQSGCKGTCVTFSNSSAFNPFTYNWGDSTATASLLTTHCYSTSGVYSVTAQATYSTGCSVISSSSLTITIFPSPIPGINIVGGNSQNINLPITFNNTSTGANSFSWNFGDGSSLFNTLLQSSAIHTYTASGNYCVKLIATDTILGCKDSTNKCFDILCVSQINIPNTFSPNGDDVNEVFKFQNNCVKFLNCTIYDRWGLEVYEWDQINGGWDGHTFSGEAVSPGVYFYVLQYENESGNLVKQKGFLNLFK